jgi:ribA/ribD-fused uncharacterized protein
MKTTDKHVFFWNGIYSQWHKVPMTIDGVQYNCCEQYMMHQKALLFGDVETSRQILRATDPREQKELGRKVSGFNKEKWDKSCVGIVYKGNYAKFSQNEDLKTELLNTGNRILVEASPVDFIWGIGMHEDDNGVENPANWKGTNLLGWSIMLVRNELMNG